MPLTQPERDNPSMRRYFQEIGLPGKRLAKRCGVSHSQIYMARTRNVGANNAQKITRGMALMLGLSQRDRLELKAEIMGHPGELVRAYLGSPKEAMELLDVPEYTASELVSEEKSITHKSGLQALGKLQEMGAPEFVIWSVEKRLMPPPIRPFGVRTHNLRGAELADRKRKTREGLREGKPKVYEALQRNGLTPREIREKTGTGRETVKRAHYGEGLSFHSTRMIAMVIGEGLPECEVRALEEELRRAPRKNL